MSHSSESHGTHDQNRETFKIPVGYIAEVDQDGRATGKLLKVPDDGHYNPRPYNPYPYGVPAMPKIFPIPEYDKIVKETIDKILELGVKKGGEYAGDEDRLANFRRNGDAADTTMEFVWRIYVSKHWDAIMQYEKDLRTGKTRARLETLEGRVDDIIVYMLLFKCMLRERGTDDRPRT